MTRRSLFKVAFTVLLITRLDAYSVLSHEALVDAAWEQSIRPVLLARYPAATEDEIRKAHAYVYGGAIIQDMGYYPFGSHLFSDLTHYIRSGDFIMNMISESRDLNEYAFALGSLAHYAADNAGHPSVNRSVPMLYPTVRAKVGNIATYEDNPGDHLKTEFSFDVAQVAEHHYAPEAYHSFIGFEVSKPLLERAFEETYGIALKDISKTVDLALGTYRRTVSVIIPQMTKVAWKAKQKDLQRDVPGISRSKFVYVISRSSYEKDWGHDYQKPGLWSTFLAFCFRLIPKVGPFRALAFHPATPETQRLFMDGFVQAVAVYSESLHAVERGSLKLANNNFDTGQPARFGTYRLADEAAGKLLDKLRTHNCDFSPALRAWLNQFYGEDRITPLPPCGHPAPAALAPAKNPA